MRIAVVSDIHGNRTAFDAVLADLRSTAPDLILHGGDLADRGPGSSDIVDHIRALNWPGVVGNTDEMLHRPQALTDFFAQAPKLHALLKAIEDIAEATRATLGHARLAWLSTLPQSQITHGIALVHASPTSLWRAPMPEASDLDLAANYSELAQPLIVYGHVHRPFVRKLNAFTIANSGSVGLPHDGDRRASYLLIDDGHPTIRRVEYDVEKEIKGLKNSGLPHAAWIARILETARPQMPHDA